MVHLCNIQMSAASKKHKHYDIDGFLSQLFASSRFEELIDKLSDEAANRIKYNQKRNSFIIINDSVEATFYNEKGKKRRSKDRKYDINGFISQVLVSKKIHALLTKLTVKAVTKIMRTRTSNKNPANTKQFNNPKTRTGEESTRKLNVQTIINEMISLSEKLNNDESDTNTKEQSKDKEHHLSKTEDTYKYNVPETNKNYSQKKTIDAIQRSREDAKGYYGKTDSNRYSERSHSGHSSAEGEDQENNRKINNSGEVPTFKGKINREVKGNKEETENGNKDENIEDGKVGARGHGDSVENSEMVSDENPHGEVHSKKSLEVLEHSGDSRTQERLLGDQRSKNQSDAGEIKPIIRNEGGKLYQSVQHADYADYYEKMGKWRKTHPENATQFL